MSPTFQPMSRTFGQWLLISILLHYLLFLGFELFKPDEPPKTFEVELVNLEFQKPKPTPKKRQARAKTGPTSPQIQQIPTPTKPTFKLKARLPAPVGLSDDSDRAIQPVQTRDAPMPIKTGLKAGIKPKSAKSQGKAKQQTGMAMEGLTIPQTKPSKKLLQVPKTKAKAQQKGQTPKSGKAQKTTLADGTVIEGEVRQRKIIVQPPQPKIELERDVTISLAFTLLPSGEVGEILPLRKAEPKLEIIVIKLLRQYRFEPLFGSKLVQRGIIHFTLERKKQP